MMIKGIASSILLLLISSNVTLGSMGMDQVTSIDKSDNVNLAATAIAEEKMIKIDINKLPLKVKELLKSHVRRYMTKKWDRLTRKDLKNVELKMLLTDTKEKKSIDQSINSISKVNSPLSSHSSLSFLSSLSGSLKEGEGEEKLKDAKKIETVSATGQMLDHAATSLLGKLMQSSVSRVMTATFSSASSSNPSSNVIASLFNDPNSLSNINDYRTEHIDIRWTIDFVKKILSGHVILTMKKMDSSGNSNKIILDGKSLKISSVKLVSGSSTSSADKDEKTVNNTMELPFTYNLNASQFGDSLEITLDSNLMDKSRISLKIEYETSPDASAIQWLEPEQTLGKKHPYLFTQCEAIHARSLMPCQDSPAIKAPYKAHVSCPSPLNVVMSANKRRKESAGFFTSNDSATNTQSLSNQLEMGEYFFEQTKAIPSYLLAIGAGNIMGKVIGPRSTVWSEPEIVDAAASEFNGTEEYIKIGEELAGPYEWEIYDILLLPPSFPYGGMENACLTFLTPSLITGDRSLTDVVAHEIAHSWTGNLVTNANWEHMWLNEGFTMFLERKIIGRRFGEDHRQLDAHIGLAELRESVNQFKSESFKNALVPDLRELNPDDVFSRVPYEKGHTLLYYLEELVGGSSIFEPYLKSHIKKFAGKSITTDNWRDYLFEFYSDNGDIIKKLLAVDWNEWTKGVGMPPVIPKYDKSLVAPCEKLANR